VQAQIDCSLWAADPPQVVGQGNPPAGWPNPFAEGSMRLVSENRAEFADGDNRASFRRGDVDLKQCD